MSIFEPLHRRKFRGQFYELESQWTEIAKAVHRKEALNITGKQSEVIRFRNVVSGNIYFLVYVRG